MVIKVFFLPKECFSALGSVSIYPAFTRTFLQPVSTILNATRASQCLAALPVFMSAKYSTLIACPIEDTNDNNGEKQNNPLNALSIGMMDQ